MLAAFTICGAGCSLVPDVLWCRVFSGADSLVATVVSLIGTTDCKLRPLVPSGMWFRCGDSLAWRIGLVAIYLLNVNSMQQVVIVSADDLPPIWNLSCQPALGITSTQDPHLVIGTSGQIRTG